MTSPDSVAIYRAQLRDRKTNSYLLWLLCLLGFNGIHRIYNGKVVSGLVWFCTLGLFGIGQFIDLVLIPGMAETRTRKIYGGTVTQFDTPALVTPPPPKESLQKRLLKLAQAHGGRLSVTRAVLETDESFEAVEQQLKQMVKSGYADVTNDPKSGVVVYEFPELMA